MYNIVLVEDEEDVRGGVKKFINESCEDYTVIGEASNGSSALKLIKNQMPDIVITDICMPNMDGLELISEIRKIDEGLPIIVISGYDDFKYAKKAMGMGVREYILKPFSPQELLDVLKKVGNVINRQNTLRKNMEAMEEQLEKTTKTTKEQYIRYLISGRCKRPGFKEDAVLTGIHLEDSCFCVAVVRITENTVWTEEFNTSIGEYFELVQEHYFSKFIHFAHICDESNQLIIVLSKKEKSEGLFKLEAKTGLEKMILSMRKYYGVKMQCVLGGIYHHYEEIVNSYEEALEQWRGVLMVQDTILDSWDSSAKGTKKEVGNIKDLEDRLLINIRMGQEQEAVEDISSIFRQYAESAAGNTEYISVCLVKLVLKISDLATNTDVDIQAWNDKKIINYLRHHFSRGSLMEAKDVLIEYVVRCCQYFKQENKSKAEKIVNNVKIIIEQNLSNEELGLDMISDMLKFSPNYIRQIFKTVTGVSFLDYLIQKRMEMAAKLLLNPVNKIQYIAECTGYSSQRYFARGFKKYYGCTPTEYRERNREDNKDSTI